MKKRVQAQRKFAQGANIPHTNERHQRPLRDVSEVQRPQPNVTQSNMTATSLLDIVAMSNIIPPAKGTTPMVIVKRLPDNVNANMSTEDLQTIVDNLIEKNKEPAKQAPPVIYKVPQVKPPKRVLNLSHRRQKFSNSISELQLRSRSVIYKKPTTMSLVRMNKMSKNKKRFVSLKGNIMVTRKRSAPHVPRSKSPVTSEFSTDDETPLYQIVKKRPIDHGIDKIAHATTKRLKVTSNGHSSVKNDDEPANDSPADKQIINSSTHKHQNKHLNNGNTTKTRVAPSKRLLRRNEMVCRNKKTNISSLIDKASKLNKDVFKVPGSRPKKTRPKITLETSKLSIRVEPVLPPVPVSEHQVTSPVPATSEQTPSPVPITSEQVKSMKETNSSEHVISPVSGNLKQAPSPMTVNAEATSTVADIIQQAPCPALNTRKCSSNNIEVGSHSKPPTECFSSQYTRFSDMQEATSDMTNQNHFCLNCTRCYNSTAINQFRKLVTEKGFGNRSQSRTGSRSASRTEQDSNDIYDFNETDHSVEQPLSEFRQNRRNNKEKVVYIDLIPTFSGILQIKFLTVPGRAMPSVRARMVERSAAQQFMDENNEQQIITLMEQSQFFEQLINNLDDDYSTNMDINLAIANAPSGCLGNSTNIDNGLPNVLCMNNEAPIVTASRKSTSSTVTAEPQPRPVPSTSSHKQDTPKSNGKKSSLEPRANHTKKSSTNNLAQCPNDSPVLRSKATENESERASKKPAKLNEAPVFYPTQSEFENPIAYIEKITPLASKYGMCKIVPPTGFEPSCHISKTCRFTAANQYPGKMFSRWGAASRELCAIKTYAATQNVRFVRPPLIDGVEVDLIKLIHIVHSMGGLTNVIKNELWLEVADQMNFPKVQSAVKKLDQVYVKYLLPYDVLIDRERRTVLERVDKEWNNRYKRMLVRAANPLHKQKQLLGDSSSDDDDEEDDPDLSLDEVDDCIVTGRSMTYATFEKVAETVMQINFGKLGRMPTPEEVEAEYWRIVVLGSKHVCVNTAAIDTGEQGYGFTKLKGDVYSKHPWNLKILSNNARSILRSLGPVLSVTVPTLHLGMVFSTSCWHRDPHGLPWVEYLHQGPPKIWYGIADKQCDKFRRAVEALCPAFCQNKAIWLPSDIAMIPPNLLNEHNVTLSKTIQRPGEFIIIFPKAYSSSICTGYTVSESVYFATTSWLATVKNDFQEVRDSFEPTMFSLEQLLISMANDPKVAISTLTFVFRTLQTIVRDEYVHRDLLKARGIVSKDEKHPPKKKAAAWNVRELAECNICRAPLYLSQVTGILDKKSVYCLQHALRILETPNQRDKDISAVCMTLFYTAEALDGFINKIQKRLLLSEVSDTHAAATVN